MNDPAGRIALVTGAANGIGAAHAAALIEAGARVAVADVDEEAGRATAARWGDAARFVSLDVADEDSWSSAIGATEAAFGGDITILVNNAGINPAAPLETMPLELWERTLRINLTGHFLGIRSVVPSMRRAGGGVIVNTSSLVATLGISDLAHYTASKSGVVGLTRVAALELGRYGIRVNCLEPGYIATGMLGDAGEQDLAGGLPVPRFGRPEEVAAMMLAVVRNGYATGGRYPVDGGVVAGLPHG